ncbi:MAG: glycosyltransferase [Gelidibacter sp.]
MISICIPIYNFNVINLVNELSNQVSQLNVPSEIILIDDCSHNKFKKINETVCKTKVYIQLEKNIGRAAIRNLFLEYTNYQNLLFLDCDAIINSPNFLSNYVVALQQYPNQLICGGRIYPKTPPKQNEMLRWKYGIQKESKPVEIRSQQPNKSFMTNNFVINKAVFEILKFDERLIGYGHEDTLFGFELKKRNITIKHINNPILNGDLESNETYLAETEKAIDNLIRILKFTNHDKSFIQDVELLRVYYKFYSLKSIVKAAFVMSKPFIKYNLTKGYINLYLFDFYKLGTLAIKMDAKS